MLKEMLQLLSDEDKKVFFALSEKMNQIGGDINQLSDEDRRVIAEMENKYGHLIDQQYQLNKQKQEPKPDQSNQPTENQATAETSAVAKSAPLNNESEAFDILALPFAEHVRQILARDLGNKFPTEQEVVNFAFENKWLPIECKEPELAKSLYDNYKADIDEANHWRDSVVGIDTDIPMAVGLTWFMVLFQLHQRLN